MFGGLKVPTGSTRRLGEETRESAEEQVGVPSGIHGHDLTLGSGSYDGVIGVQVFGRWRRAFAAGSAQYAIRSTGDYDYQFANDTLWSAGPGVFAVLNHDYTLGIQALFSGETKGLDEFRGQPAGDTGLRALYAGPQLLLTWREKLSAQIGVDLPVLLDNTELQIVPGSRLRAALTWHF